jgi:hypothetical protein
MAIDRSSLQPSRARDSIQIFDSSDWGDTLEFMKKQLQVLSLAMLASLVAAGSAIAQSTVYGPSAPKTSVPSNGQARFMCEYVNSQYTVTYHPVDRPGQYYPWAVPGNMGGGWSATKRCNEIARRLELYRRDGLKDLRTELKNQYNTVCVTTERSDECQLVFTVPPGKDAIATRDSVFRNLTMADSGRTTTGVNTFTSTGGGMDILGDLMPKGGFSGNIIGNPTTTTAPAFQNRDSIDLRPFLSTSDGGTGAQLNSMPSKKVKSTRAK